MHIRETIALDAIKTTFQVCSLSLMQVVCFILIYESAVEIYMRSYGEMNKVFGFGMQINWSIGLLMILAGFNSLAQLLVQRATMKVGIFLGTAFVWMIFWSNIADTVPYRFLLISGAGFISFSAGVLLCIRQEIAALKTMELIDLGGVK
ncbi:MAG: hypothetical protein ABL984_11190 [Pyrinomonadaceae bacterium]